MTPTEFLIQHRESIMGIYTVPSSTWNKVKFELPEIETIMTYNTFKTLIRPVVETCRFLSNELTSTKQELDKVTQERDNLQNMYNQLYNNDRLDKVIQNPDDLQKLDKNIQGWSIQFSKGYYRGFRKFGRKLVSVYLGKNLDGAENKIIEKQQRIHEAVTTSL